MHERPALITHDGSQEGVAVKLSPVGNRTLFRQPAAELWDLSVEVDDVVGTPGLADATSTADSS